jgi:transposase
MERKEYKRYSREFKLEAVRLAALGERPKAQIARQLGIRVNQLRKWKLEFEAEERAGTAPKQTQVVQDDPRALRRENAQLREEIELLKKAVIYFARLSR